MFLKCGEHFEMKCMIKVWRLVYFEFLWHCYRGRCIILRTHLYATNKLFLITGLFMLLVFAFISHEICKYLKERKWNSANSLWLLIFTIPLVCLDVSEAKNDKSWSIFTVYIDSPLPTRFSKVLSWIAPRLNQMCLINIHFTQFPTSCWFS